MSLTIQEQEEIRQVIKSIWGDHVARNINVNDVVAQVVADAITEIGRSSYIMFQELVSISTTFITAPLSFLKKFAASIAIKIVSFFFNPTLIPVINQVAAVYRSRLEMASLGI